MSGGPKGRATDAMLMVQLVEGRSLKEAAVKAEMSVSTVQRRLRDPAFAAALDGLSTELIAAAIGQLAAAYGQAVSTLVGLLDRDDVPSVQLKAAVEILTLPARLSDDVMLRNRVAALEQQRDAVIEQRRQIALNEEACSDVYPNL